MKRFILGILILVLLTTCKKEASYSVIPVIEFKQFIAYNLDSADCIISFQDGDGDIGDLTGDTTFNLFMKYLYKNSAGKFVAYNKPSSSTTPQPFDTLFFSFIIKNITPDGQYKALNGDIKIQLRAAPIFVFPNNSDSVAKFAITLFDRAGHRSNTVMTNEIDVHVPKH